MHTEQHGRARLAPRRRLAAALAAVCLCVPAGGLWAPAPAGQRGTVIITGAGSTFDYPLFSKMFAVYHGVHPSVQVNYQSIGSGGGQRQLFAGTVNFGASDAPLTDAQLRAHPNIVHIPITVGAVSVGYNLPGVSPGLRLTGDVLARIYLGRITSWTDPAIVALNPGVKLPAVAIAVVHRSDGSGTSFIFTSYLSAVSPAWRDRVGHGVSVDWPVGVGAKGSEGVSGQVRQIPGGIGYFEMAYSVENHIPMAAIENAAGRWVAPSVQGASVGAGHAAVHMPADLRAVFVNAPGPASYPISGFSWVLVDRLRVSQPLAELLAWMIHDGQRFAAPLGYAPLPAQIVRLDAERIRALGSTR